MAHYLMFNKLSNCRLAANHQRKTKSEQNPKAPSKGMILLELKNYRNPYKHVEGDKRTGTTRKNACNRETMMKIRVVIIFIIAQVVLTKHTSRRSMNK